MMVTTLASFSALHAQPAVTTRFEQPIRNANYPELLYWFVTPETMAPGRIAEDVRHIARDTPFTLAFLTERNGVILFKNPKPDGFVPASCPKYPPYCSPDNGGADPHERLADMVRDAHRQGLKIGLVYDTMLAETRAHLSPDEEQTVVSSAEATLDAQGRAQLTAGSKMRFAGLDKSAILRVYVFKKSGTGQYDPATLEEVTNKVTATARIADPTTGLMDITVDLGPKYAGETVFAMQQTWLQAIDLFSDGITGWHHQAMEEYRDVPFDGAALDEFGYTRLLGNPPWRGLFAGRAFQAQFEASTGMKLPETLFAMSYYPSGHPEARIKATDEYWDFLRSGPLHIQNEFYRYSQKIFGDKVLVGVHSTVHNHLTNDEPWASGLDWWTEPRKWGMSDEDLSLPLRMGLLVSHPGKIMYDMYYGRDIQRFAEKALNDARFNARIHYHGYNDAGGAWGVDLASKPFLDVINPVEEKIRLLNRFEPAAPKLPLLVIFGMPRLLNWFPDEGDRNNYNVNGSLHIEEKVKALWDEGYRCAVLPSDLIDNGTLRLDAAGRPVIHGHTFQAVIYLYPEYAKPTTLSFLDDYVQRGGALMIEGTATRDFYGRPVDKPFTAITSKVRVKGFSIADVGKLGIARDPFRDTGGSLEDGSVILTDMPSLQNNKPKDFNITVNGHNFSGSYEGALAIKAANDGALEKLACGYCSGLLRDGRDLVQLDKPADMVLTRDGKGNYTAVIAGTSGSNNVRVLR